MMLFWVLRLVTDLEKIAAMIVSSQEYAFEKAYFMSDDPPPLGADPPNKHGMLGDLSGQIHPKYKNPLTTRARVFPNLGILNQQWIQKLHVFALAKVRKLKKRS
ncbi:hypothetical protein JYQ62_30745 [Nostoc sp. UHCC 0702]|nr:hypothetical protein JYQ62_30745 [Nostoc sp. UHCC 0702]